MATKKAFESNCWEERTDNQDAVRIGVIEISATISSSYVDALVLGTPKEELTNPDEPKAKEGISAEEIARVEEEMESLERDLKAVEDSYGENVLNLTVARNYIKKLLENGKVVRFLNTNHAEILAEFET